MISVDINADSKNVYQDRNLPFDGPKLIFFFSSSPVVNILFLANMWYCLVGIWSEIYNFDWMIELKFEYDLISKYMVDIYIDTWIG